jgi:hypothetical protein
MEVAGGQQFGLAVGEPFACRGTLVSAPTLFSSKTNGPNVDIQLWVEDC